LDAQFLRATNGRMRSSEAPQKGRSVGVLQSPDLQVRKRCTRSTPL
jgi:hypothetical protein